MCVACCARALQTRIGPQKNRLKPFRVGPSSCVASSQLRSVAAVIVCDSTGMALPRVAAIGGFLTAGVGAYVYSHLERAPVSNRLRFINVTPTFEKKIADYAFKQV